MNCPVCEDSGRILAADVYSTLDGESLPCWETAQEMVCGCLGEVEYAWWWWEELDLTWS